MTVAIDTLALAAAWKNRGDDYHAAGDFQNAAVSFEEALRLRADFDEAYNNLGVSLQHLGNHERACVCFQQALRLRPACAEAYCNLGNALSRLGKLAAAVSAYREGLRLDPNRAEIAYNLGTVLHHQGELDEAVNYYRQALRLKPDYADASNNLATAYKEQGLLEEAGAQFQETLKILPYHALAHYNLSELAATGHYRFSPAAINAIESFLASSPCSPLARSLFCFTLGTVYHKLGSYDEAFKYYHEANDLRKKLLEERNMAFDGQKHRAIVVRLQETYDRAYFKRTRGWGAQTDLPVFIIGMPRSGSTLVEQILASHPRVFGAGELGDVARFIPEMVAKVNSELYVSPVLGDEQAVRALATRHQNELSQLRPGAARIVVKTLENFLHLGVIATLFPQARIIHCRREPLDVCLSCYFQNFHDLNFTWSLEDIGTYHRAYEKLMAHWSLVLPLPIHEVHYEDLVANQETATRDLLDFCGLDWDARCATFFNTQRVVRTASAVQVRKPMSAQAIGRWKHYKDHLGPLFHALGLSGALEPDAAYPATVDADESPAQRIPISSL